MRKSSVAALAAAPLLAPGCLLAQNNNEAAGNDAPVRPNVVFLFLDDMTYNGIHALGNSEIITPNMDRLVQGGTSFTNTYNMGGWHAAISVASRSQLMTGRFMWHAHEAERQKYEPMLTENEFWVQGMSHAGYTTYMTGKWHISGVEPDALFDKVENVRPGGMPNDTPDAYDRPKSRDDDSWLPWDTSKGGYWKGGKHWSEVMADNAVHYLDENAGSEKPLFMYLAFNAPHDLRQSPKEYVDMYDVDSIILPHNFAVAHPYAEAMNAGSSVRGEQLAPTPRTEYAIRKHRQEYYAIITHLDAQIGRIMEALRKNGLEENTVVVLAGDNGLAVGQHGLMAKQSMYEHSLRVPLVFNGCGIPKNRQCDRLVYMQDLVPTIYEMAGVEAPAHIEFSSLKEAMDGENAPRRTILYGAYQQHQRMVRDERYKLVMIHGAPKSYLFDMREDPDEVNDLFDDPEYNATVRRLAEEFARLAAEYGDPLLENETFSSYLSELRRKGLD